MNNSSNKPFVIGVAGGSGSGKSTVTREVLKSFGSEVVSVVLQDDYYLDQTHMSPEDRRKVNYDHPEAFDWPLMIEHLQKLREGQPIEMPVYDFSIDNRTSQTITVKPAPVIVVEGLFALYDADLRAMARQVATEQGTVLREGVYVAVAGPNLETRAEYRMLRALGADVVGMSTVPEVLVANHGGMRVLGISIITDMCLPDTLEPASLERILAVAGEAEPRLTALVAGVIPKLPR